MTVESKYPLKNSLYFMLFSTGNSYRCRICFSLLKIISPYLQLHYPTDIQQNFSNSLYKFHNHTNKLLLLHAFSDLFLQHKLCRQCQVFFISHKNLLKCLPISFCLNLTTEFFYLN